MSPRRKVDADEPQLLVPSVPRPPRPWRFWSTMLLAAIVSAGSIAVAATMLVAHVDHRRLALQQVEVLDFARSFTVQFLSPDPTGENGANRYVDLMTEHATGEFGAWWKERRNEILIQVARGPEATAEVLEAGLERWNDDGSAQVLVVAKTHIKGLDGKVVAEPTMRCLETVMKQGDQWKIRNFSPVL